MTNTRDAPLTFGQLSVWRAFEALPVRHRAEANVMRAWPVPTGSSLSPSALAEEQRADAAAARRRAAVEYVSRSLLALRSPTSPAVAPDSGRRIEAELVTPAGHRALVAIADRTGVFPQTVLLAMTAASLQRVWNRSETKIMLVGNRTDRRLRSLVTSMSQHVPVPIGCVDQELTFAELARTMQGASLRAFRHGIYDVDAVAAEVTPAGIDPFDMPSVCGSRPTRTSRC